MRRLIALSAAAVALAAVSTAEARVMNNTIGSTAELIGDGHAAAATVLIECTEGQHIRFTLTLTQDGVTGRGKGAGACTGALAEYPVTVSSSSSSTVTFSLPIFCSPRCRTSLRPNPAPEAD